MSDAMKTQRQEFDALDKLVRQRDRLYQTAVVDDDYPEVRFDFEYALSSFIKAMEDNKRFRKGNRYGLEVV